MRTKKSAIGLRLFLSKAYGSTESFYRNAFY